MEITVNFYDTETMTNTLLQITIMYDVTLHVA